MDYAKPCMFPPNLLFGREAVTADNISRAILEAKPEDRKYLESLLVATAEILTEKKP